MEQKELIIKVFDIAKEDFVGSRYAGEKIRELIDYAINNNRKVVLDFDNINWISQSFGDEIIGIYVRAFGVDYIKSNIKLVNANDKIRAMLNTVISYSKKIPKTA